MKFMRIGVLTLAAIGIWAGVGRAQQGAKSMARSATLAAKPPDKVVMKVGNEQVTRSEFETIVAAIGPKAEQAVAEHRQSDLGRYYATLAVLSQDAVAGHLDQVPNVREAIALQRMQILAQAEYEKLQQDAAVTPEAVRQYFNAHKDEFQQAQVREVAVTLKSPDSPATAPGLSETDAEARVAAIRKALEAPGADIQKVAAQFRVPNVVRVDTAPRTVLRDLLRQDLQNEVFSTKDGQLTKNIHLPQSILFLQVVSHQPHLKPVSNEIEGTLRGEMAKAKIQSLTKSAAIWMDPDYFGPSEAMPPSAPSSQPPSTPEKKSPPPASSKSSSPSTGH